MDKKMFCFQCEQTVGCTGCTGNAGACGKKADTARLQDELTGALISLARAVDGSTAISKRTGQIIIEGLFTTVTNVNFDNASIENMIQKVRAEKERLVPDCSKCQSPCGKTDEYDMQQLWDTNEDIRSLKSLILFGIRGMAAYAYHANVLNYEDAEVNRFFCEALFMIGYGESVETLLPTVLKVGEINLKCMALLDKANTETYGIPEPTDVTLTIEKGPFIVVTGHDLRDLQLLLEQTEGKGINIYTHGEMLPAHAYPFLKKFSHLKGNFGTAWQNQQKEFDHLPAPILYTTNCLMPPKSSYADRVFTTEMVAFPGAVHIDEKKDFTPVIEKALELGGYKEDQILTGINGGKKVTTGFGHAAILSHAGTVVEEGECVVCVDKALGGGRYDRIVKMIEQSEKLKSSSEDKASRLADRLVPYTLGGTILTYLLTCNVTKMLAVLMVDFSCALKLSMPIAVLSAMRECSNYKISVKGGKFLEAVSEADTIVFDKTGTLTYAAPTVEKVIPYVDTVLLDIKHLDTEKHKKFTGIGNEQILKNAARISQISSTVVRVPVIPGFNYSEEEIRAITEFAKMLRGVRTIHLLPYHTFGENKYDLLGRDYALADIKPLKPEELEHLKTMVEREGFQCIIGG